MSNKETSYRFGSKEYWRSPRGQKIFCLIGLAVSVLVILFQFGGDFSNIFPSEAQVNRLNNELKKLSKDEAVLAEKLQAIEEVREQALSKFDDAWRSDKMGEPEVELRALIEKTAQEKNLRFNTISTVRRTRFSDDLTLLDLDLNLSTDLKSLMDFVVTVNKLKPKLYWRRFDLRPDNFNNMGNINFNGSLRCPADERKVRPEDTRKSGGL